MKSISLFSLVAFSALFVSADSCNNKKSSSGTSSSQQTAPSSVTLPESVPQQENISRLVVSFYSIGQGIDGIMHDRFVKFLENYPQKITYTPNYWGREGEVDYCLALKELSEEQKTYFVNTAKDIILSTHVRVSENTKCPYSSQAGDEKYRLVVSFYSVGEGINITRHEKFQALLANYNPKVKFESIKWGREGEVDYCMKLSELSESQQMEFVNKVKEVVMPLVHVSENVRCPR